MSSKSKKAKTRQPAKGDFGKLLKRYDELNGIVVLLRDYVVAHHREISFLGDKMREHQLSLAICQGGVSSLIPAVNNIAGLSVLAFDKIEQTSEAVELLGRLASIDPNEIVKDALSEYDAVCGVVKLIQVLCREPEYKIISPGGDTGPPLDPQDDLPEEEPKGAKPISSVVDQDGKQEYDTKEVRVFGGTGGGDGS